MDIQSFLLVRQNKSVFCDVLALIQLLEMVEKAFYRCQLSTKSAATWWKFSLFLFSFSEKSSTEILILAILQYKVDCLLIFYQPILKQLRTMSENIFFSLNILIENHRKMPNKLKISASQSTHRFPNPKRDWGK